MVGRRSGSWKRVYCSLAWADRRASAAIQPRFLAKIGYRARPDFALPTTEFLTPARARKTPAWTILEELMGTGRQRHPDGREPGLKAFPLGAILCNRDVQRRGAAVNAGQASACNTACSRLRLARICDPGGLRDVQRESGLRTLQNACRSGGPGYVIAHAEGFDTP